jgi:hypothetical protein
MNDAWRKVQVQKQRKIRRDVTGYWLWSERIGFKTEWFKCSRKKIPGIEPRRISSVHFGPTISPSTNLISSRRITFVEVEGLKT